MLCLHGIVDYWIRIAMASVVQTDHWSFPLIDNPSVNTGRLVLDRTLTQQVSSSLRPFPTDCELVLSVIRVQYTHMC